MATTYYPAIIERGADGYSVFFPDLPGCASGGDTIDQAARNAEDALRGHLALMIEDGDALPAATALDKIKKDPEVKEAARILVRADLPGKFVRLNISLDEGLVASIDSTAEQAGMTRSGLIAAASRDFMRKRSSRNNSLFVNPEGIFSEKVIDARLYKPTLKQKKKTTRSRAG